MSCRVLKRDMELAMLDALTEQCKQRGITTICGYYFQTPKNGMVRELYGSFGFEKTEAFENGDSTWKLDLRGYQKKNHVITVNQKEYKKV